MNAWYYRVTVVGSAVLWLMVGLHLPVLHQIIGHGRAPSWTVLTILSLNTLLAVAGVWILLRAPARWMRT